MAFGPYIKEFFFMYWDMFLWTINLWCKKWF